jgi:hypothetical protein
MINALVNDLFKKKREFVRNLEKNWKKCLSEMTAQTKSFVATIISITFWRKRFVFDADKMIWSWVLFNRILSLMTCQSLKDELMFSSIYVISSRRNKVAKAKINVECRIASNSVNVSSVLRSCIKMSLTIESLFRVLAFSWTRLISLIILCRKLLWKMRKISSRCFMSTW